MKINKQTVKPQSNTVNASSNYTQAVSHIKHAVEALSKCDKTDIVAAESIANLSVVMLDLSSK